MTQASASCPIHVSLFMCVCGGEGALLLRKCHVFLPTSPALPVSTLCLPSTLPTATSATHFPTFPFPSLQPPASSRLPSSHLKNRTRIKVSNPFLISVPFQSLSRRLSFTFADCQSHLKAALSIDSAEPSKYLRQIFERGFELGKVRGIKFKRKKPYTILFHFQSALC